MRRKNPQYEIPGTHIQRDPFFTDSTFARIELLPLIVFELDDSPKSDDPQWNKWPNRNFEKLPVVLACSL